MLLYNIIALVMVLLIEPFIWLRFKGLERQQRAGKLKFSFDDCIWIHAASVGEVNAVKPLINELLSRYPKKHFVLSTMTRTGYQIAAGISAKLIAFYYPVDLPLYLNRVFKQINPGLIILVETELWPGMLSTAGRRGVDIIIVNGRLSDRSYPGYRRMRFFWKPFWKAVDSVNAQSGKDAARFKELGFRNVKNTENLKFNLELPAYERSKLRREFSYSEDDFILVWGSSRPGEEKLLKQLILGLRKEIHALKVVLAPRHLTRISEIREIFSDFGYNLYSAESPEEDILIIDEMGVLTMFYALADLAVIGGSFFNFGGHNPLEAAYYGIPTVIGKYHNSCRESVEILLENNAVVVSERKKLLDDILALYRDDLRRSVLGANALRTLNENSQSLKKNLVVLEKYLNKAEKYL